FALPHPFGSRVLVQQRSERVDELLLFGAQRKIHAPILVVRTRRGIMDLGNGNDVCTSETVSTRTQQAGLSSGAMTTNDATEEGSGWQQRALDRALNAAREKSLSRSSKFLASAVDLLNETGRVDFTVQNVVERSELSLRAFYQHFDGKDDLVLAVFE